MAFRFEQTRRGLVVRPTWSLVVWPLLPALLLTAFALHDASPPGGWWSLPLVLCVVAWMLTRPSRLVFGGGVLRLSRPPWLWWQSVTVPLGEIGDVVHGPDGDPPRNVVTAMLRSGVGVRLRLPLDAMSLAASRRYEKSFVVYDGRATPTEVAALVEAIKVRIEEARRETTGYRTMATGSAEAELEEQVERQDESRARR